MEEKDSIPSNDFGRNPNKIKTDASAATPYSWQGKFFSLIYDKKIKAWKAIFIIAFFSVIVVATVLTISLNIQGNVFAASQAKITPYPAKNTVDRGEELNANTPVNTPRGLHR